MQCNTGKIGGNNNEFKTTNMGVFWSSTCKVKEHKSSPNISG